MPSSAVSAQVPWWSEPTREQWIVWSAAWMGWTLVSFEFTVFLLGMVPISKEFNVLLTEVTAVFAIMLWLRPLDTTASRWLADRMGRKIPLVISLLWHSICNFISRFSCAFAFLIFFRALPAGACSRWDRGQRARVE